MPGNLLDQARARAAAPAPAAQMDGGEFFRAAQRAGLPTDNGTLNSIIKLVNQGMALDQAAADVKRSRA